MQNIVLINPLKPGKLDAYKMFMAEIIEDHKAEYSDMLGRYGLKTSKVYYQNFNGTEFVVVIHEIEPYASERLPGWATSTHPFDLWFKEKASEFYDFECAKNAGQPQVVLSFNAIE